MKIPLPLFAVVNSTLWTEKKIVLAWKKLLEANFSNFKIIEVEKSGKNNLSATKKALVKELNSLRNLGAYVIDLNRTTPEEFKKFLSIAKNLNSPLILTESGGGKYRNFLAKKLFFGYNTAPYSSIKLLPALVCYNLTEKTQFSDQIHSLLHLSHLLGLTPSFEILP